jgi:hypothetical protein
VTQRRPWLAAALAVLYPGVGHLYLRELRRAVAWFGVSFATAYVGILLSDVPVEDLQGLSGALRLQQLLPAEVVGVLFLVSALNVVDAYRVGKRQRDAGSRDDDDAETCPSCGEELDEDLDFCPWCTTRLDR